MGHELLRVAGLRKDHGGDPVVDSVDLTVYAGEAVAIVGPNGAGKSTLLRCVVGADRPDEGTVLLEGRPVDDTDPAHRAALAVLLDDVEHFPDLSVVEHLLLYAWAHGEADADRVVDRVLAEVGLDGVRDQLPGTLSAGQHHRLGLASCLVRPRRVLVLDEPEQRLDRAGRAWLADRLNREKAAGVGVLFSSHDATLIDTVADRAVEP
ncbi:ABC transporter ATP-binding protein [Saccharothrix violaceirubra]|uniref:ABC-type multidrug transport system ATPase subunit n=1 Tax=Saccharothrix violaceirubra TaxID=413306 RepID=A0A7W7WWD7_9PSEU|nr:ABC transporter ATP-binding protein [Saccharothrix violaceirubra]MBB4965882.1 ABC-type multidrug transport system ATPase subunit [Saccharothrix violaceirubra]